MVNRRRLATLSVLLACCASRSYAAAAARDSAELYQPAPSGYQRNGVATVEGLGVSIQESLLQRLRRVLQELVSFDGQEGANESGVQDFVTTVPTTGEAQGDTTPPGTLADGGVGSQQPQPGELSQQQQQQPPAPPSPVATPLPPPPPSPVVIPLPPAQPSPPVPPSPPGQPSPQAFPSPPAQPSPPPVLSPPAQPSPPVPPSPTAQPSPQAPPSPPAAPPPTSPTPSDGGDVFDSQLPAVRQSASASSSSAGGLASLGGEDEEEEDTEPDTEPSDAPAPAPSASVGNGSGEDGGLTPLSELRDLFLGAGGSSPERPESNQGSSENAPPPWPAESPTPAQSDDADQGSSTDRDDAIPVSSPNGASIEDDGSSNSSSDDGDNSSSSGAGDFSSSDGGSSSSPTFGFLLPGGGSTDSPPSTAPGAASPPMGSSSADDDDETREDSAPPPSPPGTDQRPSGETTTTTTGGGNGSSSSGGGNSNSSSYGNGILIIEDEATLPSPGDGSSSPASSPSPGLTPPSSDNGDDGAPSSSDDGDDDAPPSSDEGDDNDAPPSSGDGDDGDDDAPPSSDDGDNDAPPSSDDGDDDVPPSSDDGDDDVPPSSNDGDQEEGGNDSAPFSEEGVPVEDLDSAVQEDIIRLTSGGNGTANDNTPKEPDTTNSDADASGDGNNSSDGSGDDSSNADTSSDAPTSQGDDGGDGNADSSGGEPPVVPASVVGVVKEQAAYSPAPPVVEVSATLSEDTVESKDLLGDLQASAAAPAREPEANETLGDVKSKDDLGEDGGEKGGNEVALPDERHVPIATKAVAEALNATINVCLKGSGSGAGGLNCASCSAPDGCTTCPTGYRLTEYEDPDEPSHCRERCRNSRCAECVLAYPIGSPYGDEEDEVCNRCAPGYFQDDVSDKCISSKDRDMGEVSEEDVQVLMDFLSNSSTSSSSSPSSVDSAVELFRPEEQGGPGGAKGSDELLSQIQMAVESAVVSNRPVSIAPTALVLGLTPENFSSPLSFIAGLGNVFIELAMQPSWVDELGDDPAAAARDDYTRITSDWDNIASDHPEAAARSRLYGAKQYSNDREYRQVVQGQNRLISAANAALLYHDDLPARAATYLQELGKQARLSGGTVASNVQQAAEVVQGQNAAILAAASFPWGGSAIAIAAPPSDSSGGASGSDGSSSSDDISGSSNDSGSSNESDDGSDYGSSNDVSIVSGIVRPNTAGRRRLLASSSSSSWSSSDQGSVDRRLLASSSDQESLDPDDVEKGGWASNEQRRLVAAAQQNGGTLLYDIESLVNANAGQNKLIQQAAQQQKAAAEASSDLSAERREKLTADAEAMRLFALQNGGSLGAGESPQAHAAMLVGVSRLLSNLTLQQNYVVRGAASGEGAGGRDERRLREATKRWARENGASNASTLQELSETLTGLNNVALTAELRWIEAYSSRDLGQMAWAHELGRLARRRGAAVAAAPEAVCDSLSGLQAVKVNFSATIDGAGALVEDLIYNVSRVQSPLKPKLEDNLQVGSSGADVQRLQTVLTWLGYFNNSASGYYSEETDAAVAAALFDITRGANVTSSSSEEGGERPYYSGTLDQDGWVLIWGEWFSKCGNLLEEHAGDVYVDGYRAYVASIRRRYPGWRFKLYLPTQGSSIGGVPGDAAEQEEGEDDVDVAAAVAVRAPFDALTNGTWEQLLDAVQDADCGGEYEVRGSTLANQALGLATTGNSAPLPTNAADAAGAHAYYADPRAYLDLKHVFAFAPIVADPGPSSVPGLTGSETAEGVARIVDGTFLAGGSGGSTAGNDAYRQEQVNGGYGMDYAAMILDAATAANVSAYYLASRARFAAPAADDEWVPGQLASGQACPTTSSSSSSSSSSEGSAAAEDKESATAADVCYNLLGVLPRDGANDDDGSAPPEPCSEMGLEVTVRTALEVAADQAWSSAEVSMLGGAAVLAEDAADPKGAGATVYHRTLTHWAERGISGFPGVLSLLLEARLVTGAALHDIERDAALHNAEGDAAAQANGGGAGGGAADVSASSGGVGGLASEYEFHLPIIGGLPALLAPIGE